MLSLLFQASTASAIGTVTMRPLRPFALAPAKAAPGLVVREPQVAVAEVPDEPVTILFIMGESINPVRLSLLGPRRTLLPTCAHGARTRQRYALFSRIGFASGVATLASVPSLIRMAFIPIEGERRGLNLFELARRTGFGTWYFSSQGHHFLATAGGAPGAVRVETESLNETLIEQKRDDFLVDLVRSVSADHSPRQFIFVHQRGNHVPYERKCSHISEAVHIFETDGLPKDEARRAAYDNGLRCWDRNIARLVEPLLNRRGAVHVFITADHNELMGEDGLWGHLHPTVRTAAVPVLLLTNRPSSDPARQFTSMGPATYDLRE